MKVLALIAVVALGLSACTTMNNDVITPNKSNQIVTQYPVETALLNIYTKARTDTLIQANDNQNTVLEIKVVPKGKMTFNNQQAQGAETAYTIKSDGIIDQQLISINYNTLNPAKFYGFTNNLGEYSVANQTSDMPKMATIGDSSEFITESVYSDSSQDKLISKYTQSWSLKRATNDTAWFCINASENLLLNDANGTMSECYNINAKGDLLSTKVVDSSPLEDGVKRIIYNSL